MKSVRVFITGDVIGVGFRMWTKKNAQNLRITGWVKNVFGGVETVLQGKREDLEKMVQRLKRGPPTSHVKKIELHYEESSGLFERFDIIA